MIENALNAATNHHQAAAAALASIDQERPAAPTKPRSPRPRRTPRVTQPRQLQPHGTNGITEQAARVPAELVREHVRQLMAGGMTVLGIAEKAGVSKTGVKILLYGRSGARKGELPREIEESKAHRILALQPTGTDLAISA